MVTFTGTGSSTYFQAMEWAPGRTGSSIQTGYGSLWYQYLEDITPPYFKGFHGVTQVNPLFTTIFNIIT